MNSPGGWMSFGHNPKSPHYAAPNSWSFSRFLSNLITVESEQGLVRNEHEIT
jgi:hypothetical protein